MVDPTLFDYVLWLRPGPCIFSHLHYSRLGQSVSEYSSYNSRTQWRMDGPGHELICPEPVSVPELDLISIYC
jgi:hypothetical protein